DRNHGYGRQKIGWPPRGIDPMARFLLRRIALLGPVFLTVSFVIFLIVHFVPGDPIDNLLRVGSSPEQRAETVARYGLDQPLLQQYAIWLGALAQGDLGNAIVMRRPVADLIMQNLPYSLALGGWSLLLSTVLGIAFGALAAVFKDTKLDQAIMTGVLLGS